MLRSYLARFSRGIALLALCVIVSLATPVFLTSDNLLNVARQASLLLILSTGMTVVILVGGTDLSIGSIAALSSCLVAPFFLRGASTLQIVLGIILGLGVGAVLGFLNGLMISKIGLPPFVATYGMNQIARGIALAYMAGNITYGFGPTFRYLGAGMLYGIPVPVIIAAAVFLLFYFLLSKTVFGRQVYVVGARPSVATFSGISVPETMLKVYTINGLVAAFGGLVFISRLNAAEAGLGETFPLQAIGAVAIGGTSFRGGIGGVTGTIIGALIVTVLTNAMNLLGVSTLWQTAVTGAVIILAVVLDQGLVAQGVGAALVMRRNRRVRAEA
ncbi:MAG TPA: ABC transporter permease [Firmicutes bacterium]|nr:ABC transporter permease [Bacillota bacterium]